MSEKSSKINDQILDALVIECQSGNKDAFSDLYDLIVDYVYKYVYFRVNDEDVEDLMEMIFLKIWENIIKYQKTDFSFMSWVIRIAHNVIIDHYRAHRSLYELKDEFSDDSKHNSPSYLAESSINSALLKKALSKLKDNYKQVIVLRFINDLNVEETAKILKKNSRTVRVLQFRALKLLKSIMSEMGFKKFY